MGFIDDIRKEYKRVERTDIKSVDATKIEQQLNKLFFLPPKIDEEAEFVRLVLSKNGYDTKRKGLHASAIIASEKEFCYREQVLSLIYEQLQGSNIPVGLKRIFEEGNAVHEKWQRLMIRGGIADKNNLDRSWYNKKYEISFTPDAAPAIFEGEEHVVEIKSVNTFQFKKMDHHPSGGKQLLLYMYLTGIHKGFVLADDKNCQDFKVFIPQYNEKAVAPYIERLEAIQVYKKRLVEEGKLVKRMKGCNSYTCKRAEHCNMRDVCYGKSKVKL